MIDQHSSTNFMQDRICMSHKNISLNGEKACECQLIGGIVEQKRDFVQT